MEYLSTLDLADQMLVKAMCYLSISNAPPTFSVYLSWCFDKNTKLRMLLHKGLLPLVNPFGQLLATRVDPKHGFYIRWLLISRSKNRI